jgi:CO/xanthine dehydrogenase FAD-binding subunit
MPIWNSYLLPNSLSEVFNILDTHASTSLVAGGTDLLLEIQQEHRSSVDVMVDVTRIPELNKLEIRGRRLFIGAAIPLKQVATSPLVIQHAEALSESTGQIGGPQVRAVGTLGGNVAHALPAGDGAISLLALDAVVEIATENGCREVPLIQLYKGPGQSTLLPRQELIVGFYISLAESGQASAFSRVMRPQGVALPVINMAIWADVQHGKLHDIRIAVGPAGPIPKRAVDVENAIRNCPVGSIRASDYYSILHETVKFRSSPLRASSDYRNHLVEVLFDRVLPTTLDRAMSGQAD